jgi:transposase-like protein
VNPIQEAVEEIESCEPGDNFTSSEVARRYNIDRRTLARRHQGVTGPRGLPHRSLHPQHEIELRNYCKTLTEQRLPASRLIIQRFASSLAGKEVSESWVSRFLHRQSDHLISRWNNGLTKQRVKADSAAKYNLYLKLLHQKIEEHNVLPTHIFNMDEKGFQLGRVGRTKRIFSKALYNQKGVR